MTLYFVCLLDEKERELVEAIYLDEWAACSHAEERGNERRFIRSGRVIDWTNVAKWETP